MAEGVETSMEDDARYTVRLLPSGWSFEAAPSQTIRHAAQAAGITLPTSCRNGTCRACLCRARSGSVRYRIEWPGLSADEKADGFLLPCVAHPASDLVLDAPGATRLPGDS